MFHVMGLYCTIPWVLTFQRSHFKVILMQVSNSTNSHPHRMQISSSFFATKKVSVCQFKKKILSPMIFIKSNQNPLISVVKSYLYVPKNCFTFCFFFIGLNIFSIFFFLSTFSHLGWHCTTKYSNTLTLRLANKKLFPTMTWSILSSHRTS